MAVFVNCLILCVWQFTSVRSTGLSLPVTAIAYKMTPKIPQSLSLSFSTNDSMESKITKNFEDLKPLKSSLTTQDEEVSKKTVSVSKPLPKLVSFSNNDSTLKDFNFWKQKRNVDSNVLYNVASPSQENVLKSRTDINEKYDGSKDPQNKKNTVNYNIKVLSPPAVFNNLPMYLPVAQNDAGSKLLSKTYKYSKNPPTYVLPYPVRALIEEGKQEPSTAWQNVRKISSNNEDRTKYKMVEPQVEKNTINGAEYNIHQIQNIIDGINNKEEIKPSISTLSKHGVENNEKNYITNTFNGMTDKQSLKYCSVKNIPPETHLYCVPKETYVSDISPTLSKLSTPYLSDFPKPQQTYTSDYDTYNLRLSSSLDNIVSYFAPKFILGLSDISTMSSMPVPLGASELLQPHVTIDAHVQSLEMPVIVPVPELESHTYLAKPNVEVPMDYTDNTTTKKLISKSSVPYVSSVIINYMPCMDPSFEIMIFV